MPSPRRAAGSTLAAAVEAAVVAAPKPAPCSRRLRVKSGTPSTTADMKVPASSTAMPAMITSEQRPPSMTGPSRMRLSAAVSENASASAPAKEAP